MSLDVDLLTIQLQELYNRQDALTEQAADINSEAEQVSLQIAAVTKQINYLQGGSIPVVGTLNKVNDFVANATASDEITLGWTANPQATHYDIYYTLNPFTDDYELLVRKDGTNTVEHVHESLNVGTTYYYRIVAIKEGKGNSTPASANATALAKLDSVANFTLTPDDTEVVVGFDLLAEAQIYKLYRSDDADFNNAELIASLGTNSYADTDVVNENEYHYWLIPTAVNYVAGDAVTDSATPTAGE